MIATTNEKGPASAATLPDLVSLTRSKEIDMTTNTTAPTEPATPERAVDRVVRLGKELSKALDDLNADIFAGAADTAGDDPVEIWVTEIWPSKVHAHVCLAARDIPAALARFAGLSS